MNEKLSEETIGMIDDLYAETLNKYLEKMADIRRLAIEKREIPYFLTEILQLDLATIAIEYWIKILTKDEE